MVDYAIITNHTDYGMELIKSDPAMASNLASEADTNVRNSTAGNYGISSVYIDFDNKLTYYDLAPLTASARAEMQMASLGTPSIGWFDSVKKIIAMILAAAAVIIGILVGGWGLLAGAVIAGGILLYSYLTDQIEYKQEMAEINDEYARQLTAGEITQSQYDEYTAAKHKVMESGFEIPWNTILIVAGVGIFALAALMIITRK